MNLYKYNQHDGHIVLPGPKCYIVYKLTA